MNSIVFRRKAPYLDLRPQNQTSDPWPSSAQLTNPWRSSEGGGRGQGQNEFVTFSEIQTSNPGKWEVGSARHLLSYPAVYPARTLFHLAYSSFDSIGLQTRESHFLLVRSGGVVARDTNEHTNTPPTPNYE